MTVLFSDTFDRSDTNTGLGDAAWTESSGSTWGISNLQACDTTATNIMNAVTWAGVKDHQVSIDAMYYVNDPEPTCEPYLIVGYSAPDKYLYVDFSTVLGSPKQTRIQLMQVDSGPASMMSGYTIPHPYTTTKLYNYKVVTNGLSIAVYIDGVHKVDFTLAGEYQKPGMYVGFGLARSAADGSYSSGLTSPAKLDNFLVETPPPIDVSTKYATKQVSTVGRTVSYASTQRSFVSRSSAEATKQVSTANRSSLEATKQASTADRSSVVAMSQVLTADRVVTYALQQTIYPPYVNQSYVHATKQAIYANRITGVLFDITMTSASPSSSTPAINNTESVFTTGTLTDTADSGGKLQLATTTTPITKGTAISYRIWRNTSNSTTAMSSSADKTALHVVMVAGTTIVVYNADTGAALFSITTAINPTGMTYTADGRLWMVDKKKLYRVNTTNNGFDITSADVAVVGSAYFTGLSADGNDVWASWYSGSTTNEIVKLKTSTATNGGTLEIMKRFTVSYIPWGVGLKDGVLYSPVINTSPMVVKRYTLDGEPLGEFTLENLSPAASANPATAFHKDSLYHERMSSTSGNYDHYLTSYDGTGLIDRKNIYTSAPANIGATILNGYMYLKASTAIYQYPVDGGASLGNFTIAGASGQGLATDGTYLYATSTGGQSIYKIDPVSKTIIATITTQLVESEQLIYGLAFDGTDFWYNGKVVTGGAAKLWKISATTGGKLQEFTLGTHNTTDLYLYSITWDGQYIWIMNVCNTAAKRGKQKIDPMTGANVGALVAAITTGASTSLVWDNGYMWEVAATTGYHQNFSATTYKPYGTRLSPAINVSSATYVSDNSISWDETLNGGIVRVYTSLDNATWVQAVNGAGIPSVMTGQNLSGQSLYVKQYLLSTDPILTPQVDNVRVQLASASKTVSYVETTQTDFQTGMLTNVVATSTGELNLTSTVTGPNGALTNYNAIGLVIVSGLVWDATQGTFWIVDANNGKVIALSTSGSLGTQLTPPYATWGFPQDVAIYNGELYVCTNSGYIIKLNKSTGAVLTSWRPLTTSIMGMAYDADRNVFWINDDSGNMLHTLNPTSLGTLASSSAVLSEGKINQIEYFDGYIWTTRLSDTTAPVPVRKMDPNTKTTVLTITPNSSLMKTSGIAWYPGTGKMKVTDGTYNTARWADMQIARPTYSSSGNRVSPQFDISAAGTVEASIVSWNATVPTNTTLTVDTSIDGGATWSPTTNNGAITGLDGTIHSNVLTRVSMTSNGSATPSLKDITISAGGSSSTVDVSRTYSMTQAMYADRLDTHAVSQRMTADRISTASLAQMITADRITLESTKQVLTADRITLESMQQIMALSIDVSTLYAMNQAMYVGVFASYATAQGLTADRSSAVAMKQSIFSTSATNYLSTQRMYANRSSAVATKQVVMADRTTAYASRQTISSITTIHYLSTQRWYVGQSSTGAMGQIIYDPQPLVVPFLQVIRADRTTDYPTSQMSHTTRTGAHAMSQRYYIGELSILPLAQTLFAQRLDSLTLNQIIPMNRVWGHPLYLRIVEPPDKRVTVTHLVAMTSRDILFIAKKDVDSVSVSAKKDTDVVMAIRMLPLR